MEPFPFDSEQFDQCMLALYHEVFTWIISIPQKVKRQILCAKLNRKIKHREKMERRTTAMAVKTKL